MYQLYLEKHKNSIQEKNIAIQAIYRKIFNEEYNFSFHIPKKDQCNICVKYDKGVVEGTITDNETTIYDEHQKQKMRARKEKKIDKYSGKKSKETVVATFDLQAVLCKRLAL